MKKIIALLLTLVMVLALTACGTTEPSGEKELTKITVCLDWTPNTNHTGMYVALAKGFYKDAGLDVEIVQPDAEMAPQVVGANKAQFGVDAQDTLAAALVGEGAMDVTAVAAILQHNTSTIMTLGSKGITSPKLLEGKRYSTWDSPIELAIIRKLMEDDGGDYSKVQLIPNVIDNESEGLAQDQTDSIWVFRGWGGVKAELEGYEMNYMDLKDFGEELDYYTPVLIAGNKFLESNPEEAKAFMAATKKGYEYAVENPEDAAKILIEAVPEIGDEDFITASLKYLAEYFVDENGNWGTIDAERWDSFYSWLNDNGLVENGPLAKGQGFTSDYLE